MTLLLDRHDSSADTIEKQLLEDFHVIIAVCVTKIIKLTNVAKKRSGETDVDSVILPRAKFDSFQLQDERDRQWTRNVTMQRVGVVKN